MCESESEIFIHYSLFDNDQMKIQSWNGVLDLMAQGEFVDTTITVEDTEYSSNKLFLSSVSPFFKSMYTSGFKESVDGNVTLEDVTCKLFDQVMSFLVNDFQLPLENMEEVLELLACASQLQITPLINALAYFLEYMLPRGFYREYVSCVWKLSRLHGITSVEEVCLSLIREDFANLDTSCLDVEEMKTLLMDSCIQLDTCLEPSQILINWILQDIEDREKYLADLAQCLKLEEVEALLKGDESMFNVLQLPKSTVEHLDSGNVMAPVKSVKPAEAVTEDQPSSAEIELQRKLKHFVENNTKELECYKNLETRNVSVTVILQDKKTSILPCIYDTEPGSAGLYGILIDKQYESEFKQTHRAACVYEEQQLFISGGISQDGTASDSMIMFDNDSKWKKCAPMTKARSGHSMFASPLTESIFVFGGLKDQPLTFDFEEYSIKEDKWVREGSYDLEEFQRFKIFSCTFLEYAVFFIAEGVVINQDDTFDDFLSNSNNTTKIVEFMYEAREFHLVAECPCEKLEKFINETTFLQTEGQYIYSVNEHMQCSRWLYDCQKQFEPQSQLHIPHGYIFICKEFGFEVRDEKVYIRGGSGYSLTEDSVLDEVSVVDWDVFDDEYDPYQQGYKTRYNDKRRAEETNGLVRKKLPLAMKGVFWARMYIKRKWLGKKMCFIDDV